MKLGSDDDKGKAAPPAREAGRAEARRDAAEPGDRRDSDPDDEGQGARSGRAPPALQNPVMTSGRRRSPTS